MERRSTVAAVRCGAELALVRFQLADLLARNKIDLDLFWLKDVRSTIRTCCHRPDEVAAEIVESLETALDRFRAVPRALGETPI